MQPAIRNEVLRVRVSKSERGALEAIATREDLPLSIVLRRALNAYAAEHSKSTGRAARKRRSAK